MFFRPKPVILMPEDVLPGRIETMAVPHMHYVNDRPLQGPFPAGADTIYFGMGCFWGAERLFWRLPGVIVTAVGYQGGLTPNPTYDEVCSDRTGHAEVVKVVFDPNALSLAQVLKTFFEQHDPTQGMRQGNDFGTQYRSAIYTTTAGQAETAGKAMRTYDKAYRKAGIGRITTEVKAAGPFYYAEAEHQQYLGKHPAGYCGLSATGISCQLPAGATLVAAS